MPISQKGTPGIIKRGKKDKETSAAEYKFTRILFQVGAAKLLEAVKEGKTLLYAKDLLALHEIKSKVAFEDLEDAGAYFVSCNACVFNKACSLFSVGGDCGFNLNTGELKNSRDIMEVMVKLLRIEGDRIQRSLLIEKIDGGVDREVSAEMMQYFDMVQKLKSIMAQEESIEIRVKGQGAISKIFGDVIKKAGNAGKTPRESGELASYEDDPGQDDSGQEDTEQDATENIGIESERESGGKSLEYNFQEKVDFSMQKESELEKIQVARGWE